MRKGRHFGQSPWLTLGLLGVALLCLGLLLWPGVGVAWARELALVASLAILAVAYRLARNTDLAAIQDLRQAQQRYSESEQRFRYLLESLPKVAVQGYDSQRKVIYWNEASARLYGYRSDEAIGRHLEDLLIPAAMRNEMIAAHLAWVEQGLEIEAGELELLHKSGATVSVFSHHVMLGEHTDNPLMFCVDVDLSEEKQARRDLEFLTRFDALTHLPNRQHFEAELSECLTASRYHGEHVALVFIDIDRFAEINDAQGFDKGDALLRMMARRLQHRQHNAALVSRFGSDEFVMAFPRLGLDSDALVRVEQLLKDVQYPFVLEGQEVHVTASVGVSLFPGNGRTAHELIRNAEVAKNRAKQNGRNGYCFFSQQLHDDLLRRHRLAERLRGALRNDEFVLHYQPQVAAHNARIESFEALLRWYPSQGDPISPAEFIPVAEQSNLIHRLGDWVIHEVCRQQAEWRDRGLGGRRIDINLSGKQITQLGVFRHIEECMMEHDLTTRDIGIELTENVLIQADSKVLEHLRRLYHEGMKIAIDDFGTGYSSLSYLKTFPITSIKIDSTFVRDAPTDPSDRAIMEATVFIGHRLGLEVVAEGVENRAQLELVREIGCDLVQGYHFFKPMAADEVAGLLRSHVDAGR
ncbi:putative bifunctional diguanylate cyclase/phosphodiesterase [Modicisalibacter luteus]|uniref:Bifunctional diguanylate cyclase/phosphodiesterase n=1 Tax=Modicisalibacter luteus TaxID=453962 RepID=A0ABV7M1I2_9GAMM|nr:GGDEF domain-containing phosphodiesterase [Halomonas lutea]GHA92681.1 hypothetical protein GCM10007159_12830 [Halomonas lutea]